MLGKRLINTKVAGGGGCTDIVDNYDPFGGNGVALYQLNGNATDVSGNYNGTASNVTYGTGVFGQAGVFNGSSSRISLPNSAFNTLTSYTISSWIYLTSTADAQTIFTNYDIVSSSSRGVGFRYRQSASNIEVFNLLSNTFTSVYSINSIPQNTWTNLTVTNTQSEIKIYINGSFDSSHSTSGFNSYSDSSTDIGALTSRIGEQEQYFSGSIDQVRIFNTELTPLEVEALYTEELCICDGTVDTLDILGDGSCIATYQLDGNANDLSGNYSGTPTDVSYGVGEFDLAAVFNGLTVGGSIITTNSTAMQLQEMSVSAWINMSALNTLNIIATSAVQQPQGISDSGWVFSAGTNIENGLKFGSEISGTYAYQTAPYNFSLNTWYQVAFTRNSSGLVTFYVNGNSIGTDTRSGTIEYVNNPTFSIGANYYLNEKYWTMPGSIDQVRIFNKALSAGEVTTLYNETACTKPACTGTTNTLDILGDGSCIATYPLDGSPLDLSGNYNGVQTDVTYPQGYFDLAGSFNGSSSVIEIPANIIPNNYVTSISVWVKGASLANSGSADIIFQNANGGPFFALITQSNVLELFTRNSLATNYRPFQYSLSNFNTTDWYHICVTFSGLSNAVNLYVNGVNVDSGSLQSSSLTYTLSNTIGNESGNTIGWNGSIDQVRIFNKALSLAEVGILYNNETPCN